ncbi:RNA-binding protein [Streptomyces mexicanus]
MPAGGQLGPWNPTQDPLEQVFQQLPDFRPWPAREARSRCSSRA